MGLYIRKALTVGPFRFNLSKSGIGISVGVRGFRLGSGPRGNYVHMGRGGLYFRQTLGASGNKRSPAPDRPDPSTPVLSGTTGPLQPIDSGSTIQMIDASSSDLLREINEKRKKLRFLPLAVGLSGLSIVLALGNNAPNWANISLIVASAVGCWFVWTKDNLRKTTVILYELDPEIERAYQQLHEAFGQLRSCARTWHFEARADVRDRKYHAGAGTVVDRKQINVRNGQPPFVKTNLEIPLIPVGKQTLAFLPDRLLVFDVAGVGAVGYPALFLDVAQKRFVEDGSVPRDATVVGTTYRYVNKTGGPDRRFKNNPEIPICVYEELCFSSSTGLNEVVQVSRTGAGAPLATALTAMRALKTDDVSSVPSMRTG